MKIDTDDITILKGFYNLKKEEGLWDLVPVLYPECKNNKYEITKKYLFISRRIKRMGQEFFNIEKMNGCLKCTLTDNVIFCKHKFQKRYSNCVMIKIDKKWSIFEL